MEQKIVIATTKKYVVPREEIYLPLQVGAKGKASIGYERDDTGENISELNALFCELTGLYWAWKNLKCDYLGLVHYRRHFKSRNRKSSKEKIEQVITKVELEELLKETDIILPKKRHYFIETIYSHYAHTFYKQDLDLTRQIISERYSKYISSFDRIMEQRSAHMFNMFIMKKEYADKYCKFLFDVLFELKERLDISKYNDFEKRLFGRVSERLLDVWIDAEQLKYKELGVLNMERTNWIDKGTKFLLAKFFNRKYKKSF